MPPHAISFPSEVDGRRVLRAAVGALLVTAAVLGVSQAHAAADRPPATAYVIAARPVAPGEVLDPAALDLVRVDLPAPLSGRAFADPAALDGATSLAPLAAGELVLLSQVLPPGTAPARGVDLALALPAERALGGDLRPGEQVDLVATSASSAPRLVARRALVTRVGTGGDTLLDTGGPALTLTLRLGDPDEALAVVDAADQGRVTLTRPTPAVPS